MVFTFSDCNRVSSILVSAAADILEKVGKSNIRLQMVSDLETRAQKKKRKIIKSNF